MLYINYDGFTTTRSLLLQGGDHLELGNVLGKDGSTPFSLECWVKPTIGGGSQAICNKRDAVGTGNGVLFYIVATTGVVQFFMEGATAANRLRAQSVTALTSGAWNHVVLTYDGSGTVAGCNIYINGTASSITNVQNTFSGTAANTRPLWIGSRENGTGSFDMDGRIFRFTCFDKELSSAEVAEAYNIDHSPGLLAHSASDDLQAYLRMGNDPMDSSDVAGGSAVIKDRVGGFDGTPIGTVAGNIVTDAP